MRIIFMGTPVIAAKSLQRLYEQGHDIAAVFTGADKPQGRGLKLSPCPVKELALSHGTPVYHPADLTADMVNSLNPQLVAVVAFGKILRREILDIPPLGCINIHGSILPKYRGAAPIQHAILNGETETGVTSMYMADGIDDGDIIFVKKTPVAPEETSSDLFGRLGDMGAELLRETIDAIGQGTAPRTPQNHADATYAPMLSKDMSPIDWNCNAYDIKCKIRAFIPWPAATMQLFDKTLKVYHADITGNKPGKAPGTVLTDLSNPESAKRGIEVACKDGSVIITQIQAPGGKIMNAADYLRGCRKIS